MTDLQTASMMTDAEWMEEWERVTEILKEAYKREKNKPVIYKAKFHRTSNSSGFWW